MAKQLPNLDWLRVFASTAKSQSFSAAGEELSVTPGAVSQRIKALESYLGVRLFHRQSQGVRLTEAGELLASRIRAPIEELKAATREIAEATSQRILRITVLPAFAQLWLGPRLEDYHRSNDSALVEIWADATVVDLRDANFDLAIRYGRPPFAGCEWQQLLIDELVPVASPEIAAATERDDHGVPIGIPLMLDTYWKDDFKTWLDRGDPKIPVAQTFSLYSMAVEAVMSGRGFMIGHTALLSDLIKQGRLERLSNRRVPAPNQFYVVTREGADPTAQASNFIGWLQAQGEL